ncbi:MAG: hypothetical protein ACRELX_06200 [Longimicrobiales bacterium]
MHSAERVVEALRARRELWEPAPGLVGLRGDAAALRNAIGREIAAVTARFADEEWNVPPGLTLATLARADYFLSFPKWLTAACHLGAEAGGLEQMARAAEPADDVRAVLAASDVAMPPAVCYHVYAELAGRRIGRAVRVTAECSCWRHEAPHFHTLVRDWAFTMREAVCVGSAQQTESFRRRGAAAASALAERLGLQTSVVQAEDPFFLPTSRGRALLQRIKALKHELVVEPPGTPAVAIASFNHHERFFGDAFGIMLADGTAASSACIAFGIERWLLAFLVTHGPAARAWPEVRGAAEGIEAEPETAVAPAAPLAVAGRARR